jgi:hypothetical protein
MGATSIVAGLLLVNISHMSRFGRRVTGRTVLA